VSIEFCLRFEPQIHPTTFAISFLFITARAERKVCLCVKLFKFFPRRILICFAWNLSCFFPNSVEILKLEFQEKTISWEFFKNFEETKTIILYRNLSSFVILSAILFWVRIALKKFAQVISYVVCTQVRRHVHTEITKWRYGKKSQDVLFSKNQFFSLSVWDLLRPTPWVFRYKFFTRHSSFCLFSFGQDLSPKFVPQDLL